MNINNDPNLKMVYMVARSLNELVEEVVFVGGCAAALLITDTAASATRPTKDVDAIIEVVTQKEFHAFERKLKKLGCINDTDGPMCRFKLGSLLVDFMPISEEVLGYSNIWYQSAVETASSMILADINIRLVTPPLFVATKLEAFHARGNNDYFGSHDLEDIVALLDGRNEILIDLLETSDDVLDYIQKQLTQLLNTSNFLDALPGHIEQSDREVRTEEVIS